MTEDRVRAIVREEIAAVQREKEEAEAAWQDTMAEIQERRERRERRQREVEEEERRRLEDRIAELERHR